MGRALLSLRRRLRKVLAIFFDRGLGKSLLIRRVSKTREVPTWLQAPRWRRELFALALVKRTSVSAQSANRQNPGYQQKIPTSCSDVSGRYRTAPNDI